MIPAAFPAIAPAQSVGELFGPLAPIAVLGVILALIVLVAMLAADAPLGQPPARPERVTCHAGALRETKSVSRPMPNDRSGLGSGRFARCQPESKRKQ